MRTAVSTARWPSATSATVRRPHAAARSSSSDWRAQPAGLFWGFDDIHLDDARAICRKALAERGDTWLTERETWDVLHAFAMPAA